MARTVATTTERRAPVPVLIGIGLAGGVVSGLIGVGGGIILIPLMVGLLGMSQHRAHGNVVGHHRTDGVCGDRSLRHVEPDRLVGGAGAGGHLGGVCGDWRAPDGVHQREAAAAAVRAGAAGRGRCGCSCRCRTWR